MKRLKKILSLTLIFALLLTSMPVGAFASPGTEGGVEPKTVYTLIENELTYTVNGEGEATITDCDTSVSGACAIPFEIGGYKVTSIGSYAFSHCTGLTSITIPKGVTSIGGYAFSHCTSLTSITIPEGVTDIFSDTFLGCTSLTSITLPESVTNIWNYAFSGATALTSITLPEGITKLGACAFSDCSSLTTITIPKGVPSIENWTFLGCSSLTNIIIPESVTSIGGYAFSGCSSLTYITIPETVTSIAKDAFSGCGSFVVCCSPNSYAYEFAKLHNKKFQCIFHQNITLIPETKPTCTENGNVEYYLCKDCNGTFEDETGKIPIENVLSPKKHSLVKVEANSASCTTNGNPEYYFCSLCEKDFLDEAGKILISDKDKVIPAGHKLVEVSGKEPTCTQDGILKHWICEACDKKFTDKNADNLEEQNVVLPKLGHNMTKHAYIAQTCETKGQQLHYICSNCGPDIYYKDINGVEKWASIKDIEIQMHTPGEPATCTTMQTCKNCSYVFNKALGHTETAISGKSATCTEAGLTAGKKCLVCKEITVPQKPITALGHTETAISGKSATCTEAGLTAGKKCLVCKEITVPQKPITALGHNEVVDEAILPTYTENGLTEGSHCSVCHEVLIKQNIIPPLSNSEFLEDRTKLSNGLIEKSADGSGSFQVGEVSTDSGSRYLFSIEDNIFTANYYAIQSGWRINLTLTYDFGSEEVKLYFSQSRPGNFFTATGISASNGYRNNSSFGFIDYYGTGSISKAIACADKTIPVMNGLLINHFGISLYDIGLTSYEHDHSGNTPTCQARAKCTTCGIEYGELGNHETELRNVKAETYLENGYTGDLCCKICNKVIERGTDIPKKTIIKATGKYALLKNHILKYGSTDNSGNKYFIYKNTVTIDGERTNVITRITYLESSGEFVFFFSETDGSGKSSFNMTIAENGSPSVTVDYCFDTISLYASAKFESSKYNKNSNVPFKITKPSVLKDNEVQELCNSGLQSAFYTWDLLLLEYLGMDVNMADLGFESYEEKGTHTYGSDNKCSICGDIKPGAGDGTTPSTPGTGESGGIVTPAPTPDSTPTPTPEKTTIGKVKLSIASYVYNGKIKSPKVIVKDNKGNVLKKNVAYTVTTPKGRKAIGKYTYTIKFKGNFAGTKAKKLTLTIKPKAPTITSSKAAKKAVTVKWKKGKKAQVTGYQVMFATNRKFTKNAKTVTVKGYKVTSKKVTKLKAKTKYFVKVRTYKTVKGVKIYSDWSKVKTCKTK